jgi:hypothetical protein
MTPSSKNLWRLSLVGRCNGLRTDPLLPLDRKQGWNIIDALNRDPSNLAKSLRLS